MISLLNKRPILGRFIAFILLPAMIGLAFVVNHYYGSVPSVQSQIELSGIEGVVKLNRDGHGIVTVDGESLDAVFAGLGYAHAQDRLWQMELTRRKSAGNLSELFGVDYLSVDKFARTMGFYQQAKNDFQFLSAEGQSILRAYAAGVNAWIDNDAPLPVEFGAIGMEPKPWHPVDSLAILKLNAFAHSGGFSQDLYRLMLYRELGPVHMAKVYGEQFNVPPKQGGFGDVADGALEQLSQLEAMFLEGNEFASGSAWVVGARLSKNGHAMLSTDLYEGAKIPNSYYIARLNSGSHQLSGITIAGVPVILFGHNQHIAWGGTLTKQDNLDLYIEKLSIANSDHAEFNGNYYPLKVQKQSMSVQQKFPAALREPLPQYQWQTRTSMNGPLISDALPGFAQPMSVKWAGFTTKDTSFDALFNIAKASDWQQFQAASEGLLVPSINYVFADSQGNIGKVKAGAKVNKPSGLGQYPMPGWLKQYHWQVQANDSESLVSEFNPAKAWLVSSDADAHDLYRYQQVSRLISSKSTIGMSADDMRQMQQDKYDPFAAQLVPLLLNMKPRSELQRRALAKLRAWDFEAASDSAAMSIFYVWIDNIIEQMTLKSPVAQRIGFSNAKALSHWLKQNPANLLNRVFQLSNSVMCRTEHSTEADCMALLYLALDDTLAQLAMTMGSEMDNWQWQQIHHIDYRHSLFADVTIINLLFNRKISSGGSVYSLDPGVAMLNESGEYVQSVVSALSQVVLLKEQIDSQYSIATGQSGNWLSEFYDNALAAHHASRSML